MATKKTLIIRDSIATEWLMNILGYLSVSRTDGMPEDVEEARNEMSAAVARWTMDMMKDLPVENLAKRIKIANESGKDFVEITWDAFGRITYNFPCLLVMNEYANTVQLFAEPFDYKIDAPKNIHERFDIVKDEKLRGKLLPMLNEFASNAKMSVYGTINTRKLGSNTVPDPYYYNYRKQDGMMPKFMTSAYISDVLAGSQKNNLISLISLKKKLNSFKEKIDNINSCFDRLEEFKANLFSIVYDPNSVKTYIEWCVKMTKAKIESMLQFMDDNADKIDKDGNIPYGVCNDLFYQDRCAIRSLYKLNSRTTKNIMTALQNTDDHDTNDLRYLIVAPYCTNSYSMSYYNAANKEQLNTMPKSIKDKLLFQGIEAILRQLGYKYPELVNSKDGATPICVYGEEYNKLVNTYAKLLTQFMLSDNDKSFCSRNYYVPNTEDKSDFIGTLKLILPDENICKIVYEMCTDMDSNAKNTLPGFFAYNDDFFGTFAKQPAAMTVNAEDAIVCNNEYDTDEHIINDFGWNAYMANVFEKLILKYLKTNTFDEKMYETAMRDYVDTVIENPNNSNARVNNITSMTIPGTDSYASDVSKMSDGTDKMIHVCELIQNALLKSDNSDFIEWCISHKFVDKKTATARIAELDAQPTDTD
jgi:hypothetical protein